MAEVVERDFQTFADSGEITKIVVSGAISANNQLTTKLYVDALKGVIPSAINDTALENGVLWVDSDNNNMLMYKDSSGDSLPALDISYYIFASQSAMVSYGSNLLEGDQLLVDGDSDPTKDGEYIALIDAPSSIGDFHKKYIVTTELHVRDEKTANTAGGTATSGSWETRDLNTVIFNDIVGASLSSNQITLPAGTYKVMGSAPAYNTDRHRCVLYNVSDSAIELLGTSQSDGTTTGRSILHGTFTIAASKVFELRHRVQTSNSTNGYGLETNFGEIEVYSDLKITRVA